MMDQKLIRSAMRIFEEMCVQTVLPRLGNDVAIRYTLEFAEQTGAATLTLRWRGGASELASDVANWAKDDGSAAVLPPQNGDAVHFDKDSPSMTWDLDDVLLSGWTQDADYRGTNTFLTGQAGTGHGTVRGVLQDDGTRALVVTGDVKLEGGMWTHELQPSTLKNGQEPATSGRGVYRLIAKVGGKFSLAADPAIDVTKKGLNGMGPHSAYCGHGGQGGSYWGTDRWFVNFKFDEVRVTRGALRPYEFLTSRAVETSDLAYAGFDGDFLISPYADFFTAAVASAFTAEGTAPVIDRTRPGSVIHEGKDGPVVKAKNRGAIRFAGGRLVYPDHGIVADQADQTVQFFVKSSAAVAGAGLVRVNRDSKDALGAPSWAVSFADAAGNLSVAVDTDALTGQAHTFAAPVADGAWHHVAITFEKAGADTQATLYLDYVAVEAHTFTGGLMTRFRDTNLMLGAGDVANAGFDGWIDELRVTPGVLPPEQFLWAETIGALLLVR